MRVTKNIIFLLIFVYVMRLLHVPKNVFWILIGLVILVFWLPSLVKALIHFFKTRKVLANLSKSGMRDIDTMDGFQFETYLKALLKSLGYRSSVTSSSHDFGADLIMKNAHKKIVIQAKRYGYKNKVGIDAVQQIFAARTYYKADVCCVMTNSLFTKSARELAKACNVQLYNRYDLADLISRANPEQSPEDIIISTPPADRPCPACGAILIERTSRTGHRFMGCANYPNCTHTEPVAKPHG